MGRGEGVIDCMEGFSLGFSPYFETGSGTLKILLILIGCGNFLLLKSLYPLLKTWWGFQVDKEGWKGVVDCSLIIGILLCQSDETYARVSWRGKGPEIFG